MAGCVSTNIHPSSKRPDFHLSFKDTVEYLPAKRGRGDAVAVFLVRKIHNRGLRRILAEKMGFEPMHAVTRLLP